MNKNIAIVVGTHAIGRSVTSVFKEIVHAEVVVSVAKNQFGPEPIIINNYRDCSNKHKYFEIEPSKFIGKSKFNFKK